MTEAGIAEERIYLDKRSGATTDRPGLRGPHAEPTEDALR